MLPRIWTEHPLGPSEVAGRAGIGAYKHAVIKTGSWPAINVLTTGIRPYARCHLQCPK